MLKCFKVAAEKEYSQSEYPFDYCYGYNSRDINSQVYTACIPSPCEAADRLSVNHLLFISMRFITVTSYQFLNQSNGSLKSMLIRIMSLVK